MFFSAWKSCSKDPVARRSISVSLCRLKRSSSGSVILSSPFREILEPDAAADENDRVVGWVGRDLKRDAEKVAQQAQRPDGVLRQRAGTYPRYIFR
mmetsp:Transcript_26436/g.55538  ORF Transcript_26436/g.55538 Transcript_26436/m.55538 type:complete len:96 (+) Transcript_26436:464-751(+)|eukprot:3095670-Pleurochrysis_carterae.AAC.7